MEQFGIIGQYDGPVKAAVLDYGADPSGQQFQVFREYFDVCRVIIDDGNIHASACNPVQTNTQGPLVGWNVRTPHETIRPSHHIKASDIGNFTLVFGERDSCLPFQGMGTYGGCHIQCTCGHTQTCIQQMTPLTMCGA